MTILLSWDSADLGIWQQALKEELGDFELRVFPDVGNPEHIEHAAVWMHPIGEMKKYSRLKAIYSIGAGASHVLRDPDIPDVPIVRLVDDTIQRDMSSHLLYWVLHFHRHYCHYISDQRVAHWSRQVYPPNHDVTVGILGIGTLGQAAATHFQNLGFRVAGWSRSRKQLDDIICFGGLDELPAMLEQCQYLINLLPLTEETNNLLGSDYLKCMPSGAYLINAGRGDTVVDDDLIKALDNGWLAGAALDVFREEPLPEDHPFWQHPRVAITPHAAAPSDQLASARCVARNIKRVSLGEAPFPVVDRAKGY